MLTMGVIWNIIMTLVIFIGIAFILNLIVSVVIVLVNHALTNKPQEYDFKAMFIDGGVAIGFFIAIGCLLSIGLYFYTSWVHFTKPEKAGLTIENCVLNGGVDYKENKDGFYVDFTNKKERIFNEQ